MEQNKNPNKYFAPTNSVAAVGRFCGGSAPAPPASPKEPDRGKCGTGERGHLDLWHNPRTRMNNLADRLSSPWGYNPLSYIRHDKRRDKYSEQDIMTIAAAIVPDEPYNHDP